MKLTLLSLAASCGLSAAYPSLLEHLGADVDAKTIVEKRALFDAASQYVSTTGEHAFVPPGPGDQRGPCPGMNAMANHGYLPHNGIATIDELLVQCTKVFGLGPIFSAALAAYPSVLDGDGTKISIGGPDSRVSLLGLGLLGQPKGLSGSHNNFENDGSPMMGDLYTTGNSDLLQMSQFQEFYDMGKAEDNYDIDMLTNYRVKRFQQNIDENPYFFYAPFSGLAAQPAAWNFVFRLMANKSEEYPEGRLDGATLKSFYAITGEDGDFTYTPGHERIPDNWYTRNALDLYEVTQFLPDALAMSTQHIEFWAIGGNTGTTNSFVGLDPKDLTGGVFRADTLLEGNNAYCYALQIGIKAAPHVLGGLVTNLVSILDKVVGPLTDASDLLGCPQIESIDMSQMSKFPGYTQKYNGYDPNDVRLL